MFRFLILSAALLGGLLTALASPARLRLPPHRRPKARPTLPALRDLARSRGKHLGTYFPNLVCVSDHDHVLKPDWRERNAFEFELTTLRLVAETANSTPAPLREHLRASPLLTRRLPLHRQKHRRRGARDCQALVHDKCDDHFDAHLTRGHEAGLPPVSRSNAAASMTSSCAPTPKCRQKA